MARHKVSRKQLSLFEADQADLPFDAYAPLEPRPLARPGEQLPLFEGKTPLLGEVTAGVLEADFHAAREAYERLRESYPWTSPSRHSSSCRRYRTISGPRLGQMRSGYLSGRPLLRDIQRVRPDMARFAPDSSEDFWP